MLSAETSVGEYPVEKLVIVSGSPLGSPGKTNSLRVHCIGDAVPGG